MYTEARTGCYMEKISVIIPVYNAALYLAEAIDSVLAQTCQNFEIICIDDGSQDGSWDILVDYLRRLPSEKLKIFRKEHEGAAAARNRGMELASGRYLTFLDADDLWKKEKLEKQLCFQKSKKVAFTFTGYEFANKEGIPNGKVVHVPEQISYKEALTNTTISTITVMFDREKISDDLLRMPEGCKREDTATWWQVLRNGYTAYGLDEALSIYRRHRGSHSANKINAVAATYQMYREQEKLSIRKTILCMGKYIYRAVKRRF